MFFVAFIFYMLLPMKLSYDINMITFATTIIHKRYAKYALIKVQSL